MFFFKIQVLLKSVAWMVVVLVVIGIVSCDNSVNKGQVQNTNEVDSVAYFTKQLRNDSSNADLYAHRALLYLADGNVDPALRDLNQALTLAPENPSYYQTLSDVYLLLGQTENSLGALKKSIRLDPDNVIAYLKLAEVYLMVQNPRSAISSVDQAIKIDRNNPESYYLKGVCLLQMRDTVQAVLNLQISTRLDESNFMSNMQLAAISIAQGDTMSVFYLKEALKDQPQDERALFFMGMINQENKQFDVALDYFKQVMDLYPNNKRAFYHAGYLCLAELNDLDGAKVYFGRSVELDPTYVEAVYNLGRTSEALKEYKNARKYYKQSLEILPNYPLAVQGMNRLDDNGWGL